MPRSIAEIRADASGQATLRNLMSVLDTKLTLASRLGVYEFEAANEGLMDCSEAFRRLGGSERQQIDQLLDLLCRSRRRSTDPEGDRIQTRST